MALQKDFTITLNSVQQGVVINKDITITNAYIKIVKTEGSKEEMHLIVNITDKNDTTINAYKYYTFTPSTADTAPNFIKQGYEYLKTLDEYKDAVDLLDEV